MVFPTPPLQLLNQLTALAHAEKFLVNEGIPTPTHQQCLGKLVVPFGHYVNAPFHWLVSNDVGYMKYIIDKHRAEVKNKHKNAVIENQWVKEYLTEYAVSFPSLHSP
ncbi:hypothetical protein QTP86_027995 [Hemibagrus guttatus]|nr:hypothetical protein QTP86_027995 [Hemibagrus guttatus]